MIIIIIIIQIHLYICSNNAETIVKDMPGVLLRPRLSGLSYANM